MTGEMIPLDHAVVEGPGRHHAAVPDRTGRRDQPVQLPPNLAAHKLAPAIAAGCSIVLKPPSKDPRRC